MPGPAGARRLPAAVAVRGLVPLAGPHARAREPHRRGRSRGIREVGTPRFPLAPRRALEPSSGSPARSASDGGLLADAVSPASSDGAHGALAAAGRRAAGREDDYALLVEAIHEGYLLHYAMGRSSGPRTPISSLLAGDRLYALGLARLAELGDLDAVAELADVISLAAQAHAEGDAERAAAVWDAGVRVVGTVPAGSRGRQGSLACRPLISRR